MADDPQHLTLGGLYAGRYEILESLPDAPAWQRYRALDGDVDVQVELWRFHRELWPRSEHREKLSRAITSMRRIEHRHLQRLFNTGDSGGRVYVTTQMSDEVPLPEDPHKMLRYARAMAEALQAVHTADRVHGRLTPVDIVDVGGVLKLRAAGLFADLDPAEARSRFRKYARYLAPEVKSGDRATRAADVYSFGAILVSAASGVDSGDLQSAVEKLKAHKRQLFDALAPALAVGPHERPKSLTDLIRTVAQASGLATGKTPTPSNQAEQEDTVTVKEVPPSPTASKSVRSQGPARGSTQSDDDIATAAFQRVDPGDLEGDDQTVKVSVAHVEDVGRYAIHRGTGPGQARGPADGRRAAQRTGPRPAQRTGPRPVQRTDASQGSSQQSGLADSLARLRSDHPLDHSSSSGSRRASRPGSSRNPEAARTPLAPQMPEMDDEATEQAAISDDGLQTAKLPAEKASATGKTRARRPSAAGKLSPEMRDPPLTDTLVDRRGHPAGIKPPPVRADIPSLTGIEPIGPEPGKSLHKHSAGKPGASTSGKASRRRPPTPEATQVGNAPAPRSRSALNQASGQASGRSKKRATEPPRMPSAGGTVRGAPAPRGLHHPERHSNTANMAGQADRGREPRSSRGSEDFDTLVRPPGQQGSRSRPPTPAVPSSSPPASGMHGAGARVPQHSSVPASRTAPPGSPSSPPFAAPAGDAARGTARPPATSGTIPPGQVSPFAQPQVVSSPGVVVSDNLAAGAEPSHHSIPPMAAPGDIRSQSQPRFVSHKQDERAARPGGAPPDRAGEQLVRRSQVHDSVPGAPMPTLPPNTTLPPTNLGHYAPPADREKADRKRTKGLVFLVLAALFGVAIAVVLAMTMGGSGS